MSLVFVSETKKRQSMTWTEEHDKLLCREILFIDPFTGTKKGTPARGQKWREVADNLLAVDRPSFTFKQFKSVRDRYNLLADKLRAKLKREKRESGVDTEMSEVETAVEELIELEDASDAESALSVAQRRQINEDKVAAVGCRKQAMERLAETSKRKTDEDGEVQTGIKKKARRSNGSDTLVYLREKNEVMTEQRKEDLELKQKELELQSKKHDDFMKLMMLQQQQQAKQQQDFQAMMLSVMSKFAPK